MQTHSVLITNGRVELTHKFNEIPGFNDFASANKGDQVRLPNDIDLETVKLHLPKLKTILVDFPSFADGRGFSIARQLRQTFGYQGDLIADGPLIPDQYVFALQCGFNGVNLDELTYERQTEQHWREALSAFDTTYQRGYCLINGPATSIFDARQTSLDAKRYGDPYYGLSAHKSIEQAMKDFDSSLVLASSMGVDSAVLLHLVGEIDKNLPIIFLDTGKHFRETLHYRDQLIDRLRLTNVINITPDRRELNDEDHDGLLHATDPDACCDLRKVRPLSKKIFDYQVRVTGRKRYQTPDRKDMPILETTGSQVMLNPLAYWTAKDVTNYMKIHDLPVHPLLSLGFLSIGCQPCTTRVSQNEDPRAGRWRNFDKSECGIHLVDGKWVPKKAKSDFAVF